MAMLSAESLDFVDLATPPSSHEALVFEAASRGVHVLCQKPVSENLGSLRRMIDACTAAGVTFVVNENCRFQPWFRSIRRRLLVGEIGQPVTATFTTRARLTLPAMNFGEQAFLMEMPRLILFELGVHYFDTLRYLFGEPNVVYAVTRRVSPHVAGEDVAYVLTRLESMTVGLDLSWASLPTWPTPARGWADVRIDGTSGTIHLSPAGELRTYADSGQTCELFDGDPVQAGYEAAQAHFAACLRSGETPETRAEDQLHTMELVFGAYEAATSGSPYQVGLDIGRLA